jgi:Zn-dependent metalloprotease
MQNRRGAARLRASMVTFALFLPVAAAAAPATPTAAARFAAEQAVERLTQDSPHARSVWRSGQPGPSVLTGLELRVSGVTAEERARNFLADFPDLVGVAPARFAVTDVRQSAHAVSVKLTQRHGAHDVVGREVVVSMDREGKILAFTSSAAPVTELLDARITEQQALAVARDSLNGLVVTDKATPVVVAAGARGVPALSFLASRPEQLRAFRVLVDLHDGAVVGVDEITQR